MLFWFLIFSSNFFFCQNNTIDELGRSLIESLNNNNINEFKILIFPLEAFSSLIEENDKEKNSNDVQEKKVVYNTYFVKGFEENFNALKNDIKSLGINIENLEFEVINVKNLNAHKNDPQIVYTKILFNKSKYLYFYVNKYNDKWYLSVPEISLENNKKVIY